MRRFLWTVLCGSLVIPCARAEQASVAARKPRIAVVLDDFGLTYPKNVPDEEWMKLPFPLTFAVMPRSPRTKQAAAAIKASGKELIIHFPFDPFLKLDLDKEKPTEKDMRAVRELLEECFRVVPGAVGLNTHRSYKATMNRPLMRWFMTEYKKRGLYFLDSAAAPRTVAYDEAKAAGILAAKNALFLEDKRHDAEFCKLILRRAAKIAKQKGQVVVIGHHYFHGTYEGLKEELPKLQAEGFELVFASQLAH
ncbi:MAG: divergent polysaccharide deacetylase family protein [Elusimicrobiota bacterium]|jgi:hypothetical protein